MKEGRFPVSGRDWPLELESQCPNALLPYMVGGGLSLREDPGEASLGPMVAVPPAAGE